MPPLNIAALQSGTVDVQKARQHHQALNRKQSAQSDIQQLTRLTLATEDSTAAAQAFSGAHQGAAATYDLLAIQPLSERVLQQVSLATRSSATACHQVGRSRQPLQPYCMQACTSLEVDIISLDLAKRLPFKLKPGPLQAALKRGVHFEVCCCFMTSITNHIHDHPQSLSVEVALCICG